MKTIWKFSMSVTIDDLEYRGTVRQNHYMWHIFERV